MYVLYFEAHEYELSYRFQKKNMLLFAIWYSVDKPSMTTLLKPLVDDVNDLYLSGMLCRLCNNVKLGNVLLT